MKKLIFFSLLFATTLNAMEPASATVVATATAISEAASAIEAAGVAQQTAQGSALAEAATQAIQQAEAEAKKTIAKAGIMSAIAKFATTCAKTLTQSFALSYATQTMLQLNGAEAEIFNFFSGNALDYYLANQGVEFLHRLERFENHYKNVPGIKAYVKSMIDTSKQIVQAAKNGDSLLANALVDMQQATHSVVCEIMDYHDQTFLQKLSKKTLKATQKYLFCKALSFIMPPDLAIILNLTNSLVTGLSAACAIDTESIDSYNGLSAQERVDQFKNLFDTKNLINSDQLSNRTKSLARKAFESMNTYLENADTQSKITEESSSLVNQSSLEDTDTQPQISKTVSSQANQSSYSLSSLFTSIRNFYKNLPSPTDILKQHEEHNQPSLAVAGPDQDIPAKSSSSKISTQRRAQLDQMLSNAQMSYNGASSSSSSRRTVSRITKKSSSTNKSSGKDPIANFKPVAIVKGKNGAWKVIRTCDSLSFADNLNKQQATAVASALANRGILVQVPAGMKEIKIDPSMRNPAAQRANKALIEDDQFFKEVVNDIAKNQATSHGAHAYDFLSKTSPADQANIDHDNKTRAQNSPPLSEIDRDILNNKELQQIDYVKNHTETITKDSSLADIEESNATLEKLRTKCDPKREYTAGLTQFDYNPSQSFIADVLNGRTPSQTFEYSGIVQTAIDKIDACLAYNLKLINKHTAQISHLKYRYGKETQAKLLEEYQELTKKNLAHAYDGSKNAVKQAQEQLDTNSGAVYDAFQGLKAVKNNFWNGYEWAKSFVWRSTPQASPSNDPHIEAQNNLKTKQESLKHNAQQLQQLEAIKPILKESLILESELIIQDAQAIANPTNNETVQSYKDIAHQAALAAGQLATDNKFSLSNHCLDLGHEAVKAAAHCATIIAKHPGAFGSGFGNAYGNATKFQIGVGVAIYLGGGKLGGILKALKGLRYVHKAYLGKKAYDIITTKEILSADFEAKTGAEQAQYLGQLAGHYVKAYEAEIAQGLGWVDGKLGGHMAKLFKNIQKLCVQEIKTWKTIGKNSTALARKQDVRNWVNNRLHSLRAQLSKLSNEQFAKLKQAVEELKSKTTGPLNKGPVYVVDTNGTVRLSPDNFNNIWLSEMDKEVIKEAARRSKSTLGQASSSLPAAAKQAQKVVSDLKHVAAPKVAPAKVDPNGKNPMPNMQLIETTFISKAQQLGIPVKKLKDGVLQIQETLPDGTKKWRTLVISNREKLDALWRSKDGYRHVLIGEEKYGNLKGKHTNRKAPHEYTSTPEGKKHLHEWLDENQLTEEYWERNGLKPKPSTMFPANWNQVDIANAIEEVYRNPIAVEYARKGNRALVYGYSRGVPILVVADKIRINGLSTNKMVTAYPFHKLKWQEKLAYLKEKGLLN